MEKRNIRAKGKSTEGNKNTGRKSEDSRQKKAVIVGCAAAIAAGMVLLTILSAAMSAGKVPIWAVKGIGLILGCLLACIGAFFCARHAKQNGFFGHQVGDAKWRVDEDQRSDRGKHPL